MYDAEAQRVVLGCILRAPEILPVLVNRLDPDDWSSPDRLVLEAIIALFKQRIEPTKDELGYQLGRMKKGQATYLEIVGGNEYLVDIEREVSDRNIWDPARKVGLYLERIEAATEARLMKAVGAQLEEAATQKGTDADALWSRVLTHVSLQRSKRRKALRHITDYATDLTKLADGWWRGIPVGKIPSGWPQLDEALGGGFGRKMLTVLLGAPGTFKTSLAEIWSYMIASGQNGQAETVGWSSLEMPGELLLARLAARLARIDLNMLTAGGYADRADLRLKFESRIAELREFPIFVDDTPAQTPAQIQWAITQLSLERGIGLWFIDFVDLVKEKDGDVGRVAQIYRGSKNIAKLLDVAIVALAHPRKEVEQRLDKKPRADDIPYSGNDVADYVLAVWDVHGYYMLGDIYESDVTRIKLDDGSLVDPKDASKFYLIVCKARYGTKRIIPLRIEREYTLITDPLRQYDFGKRPAVDSF